MSFLLPDVTCLIFDPGWKKTLELRKGDDIRGLKSSPCAGSRMGCSHWFSGHAMDLGSLRLVREKDQEVWSILSQCSFPQVVPGEQEDDVVLLNYRMWKENYIRKEGGRRQFLMEKDTGLEYLYSFYLLHSPPPNIATPWIQTFVSAIHLLRKNPCRTWLVV